MTVRIGTRSSRLALWQARRVAQALALARPGTEISIVEMSTHGDEVDRALPEIGGDGVFTERIERALIDGAVDIAVHSLKDLPVEPRSDLTIAAVLDREEVRETLITRGGTPLDGLARGAVVGSSSMRRTAQLLALRPDLVVRPIRGNVETRIGKVDAGLYDATLLAGAGVERLGLSHRISEWLPLEDFLPAPGQGALAVQCRKIDNDVIGLLKEIDDPALHAATDAERTFLGLLGCGCSAPVAALAEAETEVGGRMTLRMRTRISAPDGSRCIDMQGSGGEAATLARELVARARAAGADSLLAGSKKAASPARGLAGMRVLITRPREQAAELCALLSERGAVPVLVPMIRIDPLPASKELAEAVRSLSSYDWIVFTSVNGVDAFLCAAREIANIKTLDSMRPAVAAVGPATAGALARWGVPVRFTPTVHDAAALAAGLDADIPGRLTGKRVLFPGAESAREDLTNVLRERGATVHDIPVYRTVPLQIEEPELARAIQGRIDAVLFMSGSAVHAFCDLAASSSILDAVRRAAALAAVGRATAEAAKSRGLHVHVEAEEHGAEALVDSLARFMELTQEAAK